ncbi:electron transport complex subunit RsxC [Marinomonas rhizomae]|uniref:Ion-translocating oxidoreductase complex subunit C n=1 Tax=Marinomonas rhizomae TaxID=491948 RepID=A0A366JFD5_9GAMM|nr:electron transport complex subunit RsxC [Marinomonas rhizomae]RBP85686.1 electron transport complex protein RnfC [Marinomonas rhizomae]RNF75690.1 electron transport complex subunit RsxC [Marinomonas rhizomae]
MQVGKQQTANVFSFHGGIHPPENKAQSLQLPLGRPSLPNELILPLGQHIGQSSRPLVKVGDKVLKGETIAINNGFLSSFLHAPTSGTIAAIEERLIAHPSGLSDLCIILSPDGNETWTTLEPLNNWQDISKTDVLAYLSEMGIIGMGGAGFPTQVKLQGAHKNPLTHFIINAAECEPYITADDMLIREKTLELVLGIEILQHLVEADNIVIGIEDNKPTAIAALKSVLTERNSKIQIAVVPTKYPSGGEKQLIQLLTGKEVPSGQYPADIGVLCQNVGTCVAVHDAVTLGKPLISRFTTLTGDALKNPQNVEVLLGTPVAHLLEYADSEPKKLSRLIMGGPMMGYTLDSAVVPIVKTSNCILAASKKELPPPAPEQACIRCGMCEQACPASLLPQQLLWFSKSQEFEKAEHHNLFDCIECGACSYVCPSSIPLVQYYRHSKSSIREAREANVKSDLAKQRFEARKARQDAEAAEKEAKRLARQKATSDKATDKKKAAPAKPAPTAAAAPVTSDESKKLKVDIAIGKSKLKKLQKQLLEAQENEHVEEINSLQLQVTDQEKTIASLEEQLAQIPSAAPAAPVANTAKASPAPVSDELKKAKVDVALIGVKLKKLQKQLIETPDDQELKDKISAFETDLKAAQDTVSKLSENTQASTSTSTAAAEPKASISDELKKLKIDAAIAKAAVKKVEKALKKAEEINAPEIDAIRQQLKEAQQRADELEKALANPEATAPKAVPAQAKPATNLDADAIKKRKIDLAIAKAGVKKAEKNIQLLKEQGKDEAEINASEWPSKLKEAQDKLAALEKDQAAETSTPSVAKEASAPAATTNIDADAAKKRKIDLAIAKAGIKKAEKNIQLLKDQSKDESEIEASEWPKKLIEAQQKLAALEANESAPAATPTPASSPAEKTANSTADSEAKVEPEMDLATQIKKEKIAVALAKAQINKLNKRLENSPEDANSIRQEIGAAEKRLQSAETLLEKLIHSQTNMQENR